MSYITQAELQDFIPEAELIQLTDDAALGAVDTGKIDAAIAAAGSIIDSYAGAVYALPLQASVRVKELARDLTIWHLEKRRRQIREDTQTAYDAAMAFLKDLARGNAVLDQPSGEPAQTATDEVKVTEIEPVFTDDNLDAF